MEYSGVVSYEIEMQIALQRYFSKILHRKDITVERQWPAFTRDKRYSPRIDIAVGPFAIEERLISRYNELSEAARPFLDQCFNAFRENMRSFDLTFPWVNHADYMDFNQNARCFIAMEIEKSGSRKHRLGDIVNASSLGRIGLIIAWDTEVLKSFLKIITYFDFLKQVEKNTFRTVNIAVIEREQFCNILNKFLRK